MITLFVQIVVLIGMVATIGYSVYQFQRASEITSLAQRNTARMDGVAASVRANLRPVEYAGALRAPLGTVGSNGRMGLPAWVVSDDRTPWGAPYAYCPVSADAMTGTAPASAPSSTTGTATSATGTTYQVRIVNNRGRDFVLQSDAVPMTKEDGAIVTNTTVQAEGAVALVVSALPFSFEVPSCATVVKRNGAWIVEGAIRGTVVPVMATGSGQAESQGEVVLYVAPTTTTGATGADAGSPLTLAQALDLWHLTPWRATTLVIQGGNYSFSAGDQVPGAGGVAVGRLDMSTSAPGRSLRMVSSGGNVNVLRSGSTPTELAFGVDADMEGISLGAGVRLTVKKNARVTASSSALHNILVDGGDLTLGTATSVTHDPSVSASGAVEISSGRVRLTGGTFQLAGPTLGAGAAGFRMPGGELSLDGTSVNMTLASGGASVLPALNGRVTATPGPTGYVTISVTGPAGTVSGQFRGDRIDSDTASTNHSNPTVTNCASGGLTIVECAATCPSSALYVAESGSCGALTDSGRAPSLFVTSRRDLVSRSSSDSSSWSCLWRPASGSSMASGTIQEQTYPMTETYTTAHCISNPTVIAR